jgi:hypothetical protein
VFGLCLLICTGVVARYVLIFPASLLGVEDPHCLLDFLLPASDKAETAMVKGTMPIMAMVSETAKVVAIRCWRQRVRR